ncbi:hypothetical protein A2686_01210 [Candidatus Woesebacteria bacterium RIFCSPHIGHO2_01_FULL_38_10]|nr:MAG: hypothetical protein A2686_01210 [Candidatus Woesebacteria bacterium RIFCSPHIGHO2_01_FULL_38_10]
MNVRLRTTAAGTSTGNATTNWDFIFTSISWVYATPQYEQSAYRFYGNLDQSPPDVDTPLAALNTAATAPAQGTGFRMRILLDNYGQDVASSGVTFKMQIAVRGADNLCDTSFTNETYADLSDSSGNVRYYNNTNLADAANITSDNANDPTHESHTVVRETYEEANNFTNSQNAIRSNQDGKWDFALVDFSATADTTYCMRVVKSDATTLDTYTVVPQFTTIPENSFLLAGLFPLILGFIRKLKRKRQSV